MTARDLIKGHEGLSLTVYPCTAGHKSIGYGWNLDEWALPESIASYLSEHGRITKEMAEDLLDISLRIAEADARKLYPGFETFNEARQAALTDFVYQLGYTRASRFTNMRRAINPDWDEAAEQVRDSLYWRQLGGDPVGTDDGKTERPEVIYKMLKEG